MMSCQMQRLVGCGVVGLAVLAVPVAVAQPTPKDDPAACASGRNTPQTYCIPTDYTMDFTELYKRISARTEPADPKPTPAPKPGAAKPVAAQASATAPVAPAPVAPATQAEAPTAAKPAPQAQVSASSWVGRFISTYTSLGASPAPVSGSAAAGAPVGVQVAPMAQAVAQPAVGVTSAYKPCLQLAAFLPGVVVASHKAATLEGTLTQVAPSPANFADGRDGFSWQKSLDFHMSPQESARDFLSPGGEARAARLLPKTTAWSCEGQTTTEANQDLILGMCQQFAEVKNIPDPRLLVCDATP